MGELVRLKSGVSIREFKGRLQKLPLSLAHDIAQQAAPLLTRYAQEANARRENVYGDAYPEGRKWTWVDGGPSEQLRDTRGRITNNLPGDNQGHWEGSDADQVSLVRTGKTRDQLRFVVNGTIIRCALGPRYAKYLIGKYKILPIGDRTAMPANWTRALDELVRTAQERPSRVAA
jgi:hypothetical protein